eukprot:11323921-Alexandrium_andersonii.AAC.1
MGAPIGPPACPLCTWRAVFATSCLPCAKHGAGSWSYTHGEILHTCDLPPRHGNPDAKARCGRAI